MIAFDFFHFAFGDALESFRPSVEFGPVSGTGQKFFICPYAEGMEAFAKANLYSDEIPPTVPLPLTKEDADAGIQVALDANLDSLRSSETSTATGGSLPPPYEPRPVNPDYPAAPKMPTRVSDPSMTSGIRYVF